AELKTDQIAARLARGNHVDFKLLHRLHRVGYRLPHLEVIAAILVAFWSPAGEHPQLSCSGWNPDPAGVNALLPLFLKGLFLMPIARLLCVAQQTEGGNKKDDARHSFE